MKIAVKVKIFKLYGYVLLKSKKVYNECLNDISIQNPLHNSWPQIKKKTETYDWSLFQDLSNGVLHHL